MQGSKCKIFSKSSTELTKKSYSSIYTFALRRLTRVHAPATCSNRYAPTAPLLCPAALQRKQQVFLVK